MSNKLVPVDRPLVRILSRKPRWKLMPAIILCENFWKEAELI